MLAENIKNALRLCLRGVCDVNVSITVCVRDGPLMSTIVDIVESANFCVPISYVSECCLIVPVGEDEGSYLVEFKFICLDRGCVPNCPSI